MLIDGEPDPALERKWSMKIFAVIIILVALSLLVVCSCALAKGVLETPEEREEEDREQIEWLNEWARKKGK